MGCVKFTPVKLIVHFVALGCFMLLILPENCEAGQKFAVQIAASKTALNSLSKKTENIVLTFDSLQQKSEIVENGGANDLDFKSDTLEIKGLGDYFLNLIFNKSEMTLLKNDLIAYGKNRFPQNVQKFYVSVVEKSFQFPGIIIFIVFILFFIRK